MRHALVMFGAAVALCLIGLAPSPLEAAPSEKDAQAIIDNLNLCAESPRDCPYGKDLGFDLKEWVEDAPDLLTKLEETNPVGWVEHRAIDALRQLVGSSVVAEDYRDAPGVFGYCLSLDLVDCIDETLVLPPKYRDRYPKTSTVIDELWYIDKVLETEMQLSPSLHKDAEWIVDELNSLREAIRTATRED